jgi:hypothetical protein
MACSLRVSEWRRRESIFRLQLALLQKDVAEKGLLSTRCGSPLPAEVQWIRAQSRFCRAVHAYVNRGGRICSTTELLPSPPIMAPVRHRNTVLQGSHRARFAESICATLQEFRTLAVQISSQYTPPHSAPD